MYLIEAIFGVSTNYLLGIFIDCGMPSYGNIRDKRLFQIADNSEINETANEYNDLTSIKYQERRCE